MNHEMAKAWNRMKTKATWYWTMRFQRLRIRYLLGLVAHQEGEAVDVFQGDCCALGNCVQWVIRHVDG